jgi:hypothetical protein
MTRYYNSSRHTNRNISAQHLFRRIASLVLFSLLILFTVSCEKGELKLGTDFLPAQDFVSISSIDTLSVFSYTMFDGFVESDNPAVSYLGQISDPVFGTTTAEFVTQLRLDSKWTGGKVVKIDSVYLYWHLLSVTGATNVPHTFKISEISDVIYPDSVYYSNKKPNLAPFSIDNIEIPAGVAGDTSIVIKISNEFGERIFNDPSQLFYDPAHIHFTPSSPDFRSYFKGIYVQMNPSTDPIMTSLYLAPPNTNNSAHSTRTNFIAIFLKDSTDLANGTEQEFDLLFDANAVNAAYNRYSHDYLTAAPELRINHINDNYKDTLSYLQYLNGVYTKIELPGLEKLKNDGTLGRIGVNKAKLVVPVYFTDATKHISNTVPPQLVLRYKNSSGTKTIVPDYTMGSTYDQTHIFFDGTLDSINKVYNFNIPQFVQQYLEGTNKIPKPELEIYQGGGTRNVVLRANDNKTPLKFEFTYTKF